MTDAIPIDELVLHNSPDIHAWPATTAITKLALQPTGVHVEFGKQDGPDRWPDVPFGDPADHGTVQYTLWIALHLEGAWHAGGMIEFWHGLFENGGPVDGYARNWYYAADRWAPMTGHQPAPGEVVGFLVTSGDARHGGQAVGLLERSNIVTVPFPQATGATFTFNDAPPPVPPAPPPLHLPALLADQFDIIADAALRIARLLRTV